MPKKKNLKKNLSCKIYLSSRHHERIILLFNYSLFSKVNDPEHRPLDDHAWLQDFCLQGTGTLLVVCKLIIEYLHDSYGSGPGSA
jgi:hypothetical protein